jgi:soluble lytic murein transglycosylase-like protein
MRLTLLFIFVIVLLSPLPDLKAAMYSYVDQYGAIYGRYGKFIRTASERYGLDPELIRAIIKVESSFNPYAVSEKGAMGLMQLMPETAEEMQVGEPFEAKENIMGGSRYLRKLLNMFDGDLRLGLAAYNAGPNKVLKNRSIPKIPETEQYVKKVMREYGRTRANAMARQQ